MIINVSGSENRTDEYDEMDVYQLNDFLEDVLHEKMSITVYSPESQMSLDLI